MNEYRYTENFFICGLVALVIEHHRELTCIKTEHEVLSWQMIIVANKRTWMYVLHSGVVAAGPISVEESKKLVWFSK